MRTSLEVAIHAMQTHCDEKHNGHPMQMELDPDVKTGVVHARCAVCGERLFVLRTLEETR